MADEPKTPVEQSKPVIKSWNEMKKEAKTKAREKQAEKILAREKKSSSSTEPESTPKVDEDRKGDDKEKPEVLDSSPKVDKEEPKIDIEAVARKAAKEAADDAAKRVGDETKAAFTSEINKILTRDNDLQQKQKQADELIAAWDKENRLPKNYKELIDETMRIADAKVTHREQEAKRLAQEPEPPAPLPLPSEETSEQKLGRFQKEITDDLESLYTGNDLPRPANLAEINNPNTSDANAKVTQDLLNFGVKLNTSINKRGGTPITSLKGIYEAYKLAGNETKVVQPPGADAPVSPSRNQSVTQQPTTQPFYQKGEDGHYHAKSWAQIKYEALKSRITR